MSKRAQAMAPLDPDLVARLTPHLARGERLSWVALPAKRRARFADYFIYLFAIPWTAFALFWEGGVFFQADGAARIFMMLFGLPFVLIGFTMLASPLLGRRAKGQLVYGVTDRRALILREGPQPGVHSFGAGTLADFKVQDERDGLLDLYFAVGAGVEAVKLGGLASQSNTMVGFMAIPADGRAQQALAVVKALPAPVGPAPGGDETTVISARGGLEAFRVKLKGQLTARQEDVARRRGRAVARFHLVALAVLALVFGTLVASGGLQAFMVVLIVGLAGLVLAVGNWVIGFVYGRQAAEVARLGELDGLLAAWQQDLHPKGRCTGWVDLRDAQQVPAYRFATSQASGRLKTYHRHLWTRVAFATACGSSLVVELQDKVKYKAGTEVRRAARVRGRLLVNRAVWQQVPAGDFAAGPLRVRVIEREGRTVLLFRGEVSTIAQAGEAVSEVYEALGRAQG